MNLPPEYFVLREMKYREMLIEEKRKAEYAKPRLLSLDPVALEKAAVNTEYENKSKLIIAMEVKRYFNEALFFPDQYTLKKLEALNIKESVTRWFVPLEEIHKHYQIIRDQNIKIDALFAFTQIKTYLTLKFNNDLLFQMTPKNRAGESMTELTNDLINLKGRRRYSGSDPKRYKNVYEILLNSTVNDFIEFSTEHEEILGRANINSFIQFSKGKTETIFLRKVVEECFQYDKKTISKLNFLNILYDLFRLFLQDRTLPSKADFDEYHSEKTYKNFYAFKTKTLRAILYPKG